MQPSAVIPRRDEDARVIGSLAALIIVALLMVATAVVLGSDRQDDLQRANEERVVAFSVESVKRALTTAVRDHAWWSEAVRSLVLNFDEAWADTNIGPYVHATFGYDVALVIGGDDRPIIGWLRNRTATSEAASTLGERLSHLIVQVRQQQLSPEPTAVAAILLGKTGLFVAAASPIVPQPGFDLQLPPGPPAVLVFAKRLDDPFLARVEADFGLNKLAFASSGTRMPDGLGHARLDGPSGEGIGEIVWQPWHPGRTQLGWLIPALLGSLVVFTVFTQLVLKSIRRATAVVRQSEARFRDIADAASDWIWETDQNLLLTYVSEQFGGATGLNPADVVARPLHQVLELCDQGQRVQHETSLRAGAAFRDVLCQLHPEGGKSTRTLRVAGKPIHDAGGDFRGYRGTATDITSEIAALRQVQFLARHDPLTKLPNRTAFHDRLAEILNRCGRHYEQAAVLCIDLDRFKEVNDSLGHAAGDQVLMECAERLRNCVRETDLVARLGGDEFAVLLAGVTAASDIQALCERVLAALAEPFEVEGVEAVVGASVGSG
jgi:diguanylate cyclase (GGDEF)-like protein/PAS domain S-box-containing protein